MNMKVTYIHHSSFLTETAHASLLFDYFEGPVGLSKGKPAVIFASHRHGDHFSPAIFDLAEGRPDVYFVLSDDIWRKRVPEGLTDRTLFIGPGQETALPWLPWIKVRTFRSTDEGVAFLLDADGTVIYHAGDLNNWQWAGESELYNRKMEEEYHRQLKAMAGEKIDVAFVPLDPRQERDFYKGMDDFMNMVGAKTVFPMHCWGDFSVIGRLKSMERSAGYRDRIVDIKEDGQAFEL